MSNHREVAIRDGAAIPRFLGGRDAGVCLEAPAGVDASQWRVSLRFESSTSTPGEPRPPTAASGNVLCFERPWPAGQTSPARVRLCGTVTDLYDGTVFDLPCTPVRYETDAGARTALLKELDEEVRHRHDRPLGEFLDRLGGLAERARARGFPALGVRIDLIAVHYTLHEGEGADRPRARRLLDALPRWLGDPAAVPSAADAVYLRGSLDLMQPGGLESAWREFLEAHALYRRILDKKRLAAVRGEAEVLARVGAVREALYRLDAALADCAESAAPADAAIALAPRAPCSAVQRFDTRGLRAWLTLIDSDASPDELSAAEHDLDQLQTESVLEPQERANHLVNLALLRARQGHEPSASLDKARDLVAAADSRRADLLAGWGRMAEALYELSRTEGDLTRARRQCSTLTAQEETPRLTAWAYSCLGRILHRQGRLEAADDAFERALALHEHTTAESLGRWLPLGPGQRADDHYRAARLALDRGRGARAWEILDVLDRLPEEGPEPPLSAAPTEAGDPDAGYRAFAVDDEVFLLHRDRSGVVSVVRRTHLPAGGLRELTDAIERALEKRTLSDAQWSELTRPLAQALLPDTGDAPEPVTVYRLHGLLQRVPLGALPLGAPRHGTPPRSEGDSAAGRWFADRTVVAVRPAGAPSLAADPGPDSSPLVVLDPAENLGSRQEMASFYSGLFPAGHLLVGRQATVRAVERLLPAASWLHADTHGSYDPAFPERSSLELADGMITLRELARLPLALRFANLSGCRTGSWPVTADSGRFGIGGLLARRGARWVVASRSDLLDRVALAFNPPFYRALESGAPVPEAYGRALRIVRQDLPAVAWASLFLLQGGATETERTAGGGAISALADSLPLDNTKLLRLEGETRKPLSLAWR